MSRITFTVEAETSARVERMRAESAALARRIRKAVARLGPGEHWELLEELPVSLDRLGEGPSAAAVVREALAFYLASIDEVAASARRDEGYAVLAQDREREETVNAVSGRAADRWADEP